MKNHYIPSIIPVLMTCTILQVAVTSCTNAPTNPIETVDSRSIFIGSWLNEGELSNLTIREDGSCILSYDDPNGVRDIQISGRWTIQGNTLRVNYDKRWWGSNNDMTQTYHLKSGKQHTLWIKRDGDEALAFYLTKA